MCTCESCVFMVYVPIIQYDVIWSSFHMRERMFHISQCNKNIFVYIFFPNCTVRIYIYIYLYRKIKDGKMQNHKGWFCKLHAIMVARCEDGFRSQVSNDKFVKETDLEIQWAIQLKNCGGIYNFKESYGSFGKAYSAFINCLVKRIFLKFWTLLSP